MELYHYIIIIISLLVISYFFWATLQITLAAWGSDKVSEKWLNVANSPMMKHFSIRWLGVIVSIGFAVQLILIVILAGISIYGGKPIMFIGNPVA